MRQVFQWEGSHQKTFDTLKIDIVPMIALPDLQQSCKIETSASTNVMRTNMLFRSPSVTSIILKNVSLAHINNVGWYAIDEIFKDVCGIFQGLQVKKFCLQDNLLHHLSKPCIPSFKEVHVIEEASTSFVLGHLGIIVYLQGWHFPRRKVFVTTIVKECVLYFCKPTNERPGLYTPLPISSYPWESFSVDFVRGLPMSSMSHVYLCVAVDRLCDKQVALLFSQYVWVHFGLSTFIISDRESRLLGESWTNLWQLMDTKMGRSITFHPQADRQTEVVNNTVVQLLQGYCNQHPKSWNDQLPYVQPMYNQVMYSFTQDSPVETCLGYLPKIPLTCCMGKMARREMQPTSSFRGFNKSTKQSKSR
jgi:hypothetical protein